MVVVSIFYAFPSKEMKEMKEMKKMKEKASVQALGASKSVGIDNICRYNQSNKSVVFKQNIK
jgi:hypothetical protein